MGRSLLVVLLAAGLALVWLQGAPGGYGLAFDPEVPVPGQTLRVLVTGVPRGLSVSAEFTGTPMPAFRLPDGTFRLLVPVHGLAEGGLPLELRVRGLRSWSRTVEIPIAPKEFPEQKIRVPKRKRRLYDDPGIPRARELLGRALSRAAPEQRWDGRFLLPVEGRHTGRYGNRRYVIGKGTRYYHKGTDLAAPVGTVVRAGNRGRVTLVDEFPLHGKLVLVDHGQGVVSVYQHLDTALAKQGHWVDKGDPVGTVGSTGISTGPHLHWSLWVHGIPVDPLDWVDREF